jgi:cytochrome c biogenesis factor
MRIHIRNKVSLILILMAGASLVSMLATLRRDQIVHHDLYNYGLQFSTQWAIPYWTMAAIVFSMGWLIILTSIAFELHLVIQKRHRLPEPEPTGVRQEQVQNETPRIEAKPNGKPEEEEVKTTALAVKTEDELSEFRIMLEEISQMTQATVVRQKADDKSTDEK